MAPLALAVSDEATELLELVVSVEGVLLAVEELGVEDDAVLELGGVEDWSAYVPLVPCAVLDDLVVSVAAVEELVVSVEDGDVELELRSDEVLWGDVLAAAVLLLSVVPDVELLP